MTKTQTLLAVITLLVSATCAAQTRYDERSANPAATKGAHLGNPFAGKWTYRSYHNRPDVIVDSDATKALGLIFGEGVMTLDDTDLKVISGVFEMGPGYALDLKGTVRWQTYVAPTIFEISGVGRPGTATEGWQYDYVGYLAWEWPNGIGQVPSIVGTVIRSKPHGSAKAGYVASFIASKSP